MSSTPSPTVSGPTRRDDQRSVTDQNELSTLLGALEDDDCRAIIEATSDEALTTGELCETCDLSSSTAYRKVDELTGVGLLEERIRLCPSGSHESEYTLAVTDLEISLGSSGCELSMTEASSGPQMLSAD